VLELFSCIIEEELKNVESAVCLQIKWSDLQPTLVKKLGSGSFGQVYEAYFHAASMAVKIMTLDAEELDPTTLKRFKCVPTDPSTINPMSAGGLFCSVCVCV
jgi:hypothetical protein